MKVSAIITTHNRCELLKKAIKSVIKQTYKNIECIVIDDNSQDDTQKYMENLIKEYRFIKYIRITEKEHQGGAYARNLGIKESSGEYIAFLDDDDEWMDTKIEKQVEILDNNKDVSLVICGRKIEYYPDNIYVKEKTVDEGIKDYSKKILYNIIGVTSMMMFRRDVLDKVNYFDEKLNYWQEYDLTIRVCQISKVAFLDECLILYRVNKKDKNRKTNHFDSWLETTQYINHKYSDLINKLTNDEKKKVKALVFYDAANRCDAIGDKKRKKYYYKEIYKLNPTLKNYIKYVFNIDKNSLIKLRTKVKELKDNV